MTEYTTYHLSDRLPTVDVISDTICTIIKRELNTLEQKNHKGENSSLNITNTNDYLKEIEQTFLKCVEMSVKEITKNLTVKEIGKLIKFLNTSDGTLQMANSIYTEFKKSISNQIILLKENFQEIMMISILSVFLSKLGEEMDRLDSITYMNQVSMKTGKNTSHILNRSGW